MRVFAKCPNCGTNQGVGIWAPGMEPPKLDHPYKMVVECASAGRKKGCGKDFVATVTLHVDVKHFKIEAVQ